MLLKRSTILELCLFLAIIGCNSQHFESEYSVDEADHSDISEDDESNHPDYSKYYSVDTSAPLVSGDGQSGNTGFLSPIEFSGFFGPIDFGESNQKKVELPQSPFQTEDKKVNGFIDTKFPEFQASIQYPTDYFEESRKKIQKDNPEKSYDAPSSPTYVTHGAQEFDDIRDTKSSNKKESEVFDDSNYKKPTQEENKYKLDNFKYSKYPKKYANTGKSSTVYPKASGYTQKHTKKPTPYQKYSFQPVTDTPTVFKSKYLEQLISTAAPFNPSYAKLNSEASNDYEEYLQKPTKLAGKDCKKIQKQINEGGENKNELMNCYVCDEPLSNGESIHCSYATDDQPVRYYEASSERYSVPGIGPDGFRYKRYAPDPYEYVKKRSQKEAEPEKDVEEEIANFGYYSPEFDSDDYEDKSSSEKESEKVRKDPKNCKQVEKDGMTCTICKSPSTGGNYEQCSYTVEPQEEKYAYVNEKKYDSDDESDEGSESKQEDTKPVDDVANYRPKEDYEVYPKKQVRQQKKKPKVDDYDYDSENTKHSSKYREAEDNDDYEEAPKKAKKPRKLIEDDPYYIPAHFAESTTKEEKEPTYFEYLELDEGESEAPAAKKAPKEEDEYAKFFPEYDETQVTEVLKNPADSSRKDVEEVLAEFSKKDRSACKKAAKNGMTCYLCVDKNGIQNEECMFVSESKPKASHLAYHNVQQIKEPEKVEEPLPTAVDEKSEGSEHIPVKVTNKQLFQKTVKITPTLETAASQTYETRIRYSKPIAETVEKSEPVSSGSNVHTEKEEISEEEPTQETPSEFIVGEKEGAFSAETKPVYSKALGVTLPKYMIEKSEFEKEFDDFSKPY